MKETLELVRLHKYSLSVIGERQKQGPRSPQVLIKN